RHTAAAVAALYDDLLYGDLPDGVRPPPAAHTADGTGDSAGEGAGDRFGDIGDIGDRPAAVRRPAVVPIECRESTYP
ncbi:hypothetical protein G3I66_24830, partial [Streptomyces rubrogriseus]|nr:hypothetical protein [Streptomyces rubrogriseus]